MIKTKSTATVEMLNNGKYFIRFNGEVIEHIRKQVIKRHGKSTKRILKKRIKAYMYLIIVLGSKIDVDNYKSEILNGR